MNLKKLTMTAALLGICLGGLAQERLSLEDCRNLAVKNNKSLEQARISKDMAHYDRAIARANYFPNISAMGTYERTSLEMNLISDEQSAALRNAGTAAQAQIASTTGQLMQLIQSNPSAAMEYMQSPMWQTMLGALSQTDISQAVNQIGCSIDNLLHPDMSNVALLGVSLQQPVFVGGKITASNKIARLAEDLAKDKYDIQYQQTIVDTDKAYWQIVSIAAKKELASQYADFLRTMDRDAGLLMEEGIYTASDCLAVKVKSNEASMMLTQAENGLKLAKMLLCQMVGLPLDSDITLADEGAGQIPLPQCREPRSIDEIIEARAELRSLNDAVKIYDQKVKVARADMMPKIALNANYLFMTPNFSDGFQTNLSGFWTVGASVKIPIFHGLEALKKTQKAKAEAALYRSKYDESVDMVNLEVSQLRARRSEAIEGLSMARSNLDCAEENLKTAMLGFEEGVVESSVTLAAQAAWLKAHSQYIDAGIELQMVQSNLDRAQGYITEK